MHESALSRYSDLVLVAAVIAIVALMVLPLPASMIDLLVAINLTLGVMLLLMSIYIGSPLEFSVFPSVLLISTLFRLALAIATTRMILLHGDAGHIINTFGKTVAGGNLIVGLVVFLIITVVQFIVIAKGAERVAEVAARFTLDAMPGKQLSIDSDLRSGLIDKEEARRKRRELELESKLHGHLDGAMKFVKGDAIAGIVIIAINLLGGLAVGVLQKQLEIGQAMTKYSVLAIGDGMVSQIPALLAAMASGLIVTRASDAKDKHLGDSMARQFMAKPRVLLVAGGLCGLLALMPGFPSLTFMILGVLLTFLGGCLMPSLLGCLERACGPELLAVLKPRQARPGLMRTALLPPAPMVPLLLSVPKRDGENFQVTDLQRALELVLSRFQLGLGVTLPHITIETHSPSADWEHKTLQASAGPGWTLMAFEVPIARGELPTHDAVQTLADAVQQALRRHAALFMGIQETSELLARAATDHPEVVKESLRSVPVQRMSDILRRLVEEEVPVRHLRDLLEALAEAGQREKDVATLSEFARVALKRHISHRCAPDGVLRATLLMPGLEDALRQSLRSSGGVQQLALDPATARQLVDRLCDSARRHAIAAFVTTIDLRRHVRKLVELDCFDVPVLSYHELMPSLKLEVAERVDLPAASLLQAA